MEIPQITNQSSDTTQATGLTFGRIGVEVRNKLLEITPQGSISNPITTTLRQYEQVGEATPVNVYERRLYVNKNGVTIGIDSVNVQLAIDNPAKTTNQTAFYDPAIWVGLDFV